MYMYKTKQAFLDRAALFPHYGAKGRSMLRRCWLCAGVFGNALTVALALALSLWSAYRG